MTQIKYANPLNGLFYTESRTYNTSLQLTRLTVPGALDMEYEYHSTQNNGQITRQKDWVSGEDVSYTYDSLQRLITATTAATGPQWGQSYAYDVFGNMTGQSVTKGSAPAFSLSVSSSTNRISTSGFTYDANGNTTAQPGVSAMSYDVDNRIWSSTGATARGDYYAYGPDGKRIWKHTWDNTGPSTVETEEFYFYGISGQKLGSYQPFTYINNFYLAVLDTDLYFGGKKIVAKGASIHLDRLGSNRNGSKYFPYGQEQTVTANEKDKYGTYYRDSTTALDYADQRYYSSNYGRFTSPDPYKSSAGSSDPGSWNRYRYAGGDPVNLYDPAGLQEEGPPNNPYDQMLELIRYRLEASADENGDPPHIDGVHDKLQDSTRWGREAAIAGMKIFAAKCGDLLARKLPGSNYAIGDVMVGMIDSLTVVTTWDSVSMNASYGELFGGNQDETMLEWILNQPLLGPWQNTPNPSWDAANLGSLVIVNEKGAKMPMQTMIHELLHAAFGSGANSHLAITAALGVFGGSAIESAEFNEYSANFFLNGTLDRCVGRQ